MALQNRVTPFGEIVATAERGMFTGNRGIIHDPATRTLLSKRWATKAWITCVCEFKGRRREVMAARSWTELFFLDEATAFAAGHRPCFFCRRDSANAFRSAWAKANGGRSPPAREIDEILHGERLFGRTKKLHPLLSPVSQLPDGTMVEAHGVSYLILGGRALHWSPGGYLGRQSDLPEARLLTPPSTVRAFDAGYRPLVHPSASPS